VNDLADRGGRLVVREVEDQPVIVVVGAAADRIDEGGRIGVGA
jgi:UDP-N-acetylmuramyl tripeptide synthase